jgi:hypothetical protein
MLTRRGIFGVLTGLVAAPLVVKANVLMPLRGVKVPPDLEIPSWCPHGWVPAMGQTVSKFQFPELYKAIGTAYGSEGEATFKLPNNGFSMMWYNGFETVGGDAEAMFETTVAKPSPIVSLISTQRMVRSNGTQCIPGMLTDYVVELPTPQG